MVNELRRGLVVSCQAEEGSPFNAPEFIAAFAKAAELGGAVGVRVRDPENVAAVRSATNLPVIGLTKSHYSDGTVLITPDIDAVMKLVDAGADIIAFDATARKRPNGMSGVEFLKAVKSLAANPIIADISNFQEGVDASDAGADYVATTLSGYIGRSISETLQPDYDLIRRIASGTKTPIIAEGRIWSPDQAKTALELGAFAVCVGSAITRPVDIIKRFAAVLR